MCPKSKHPASERQRRRRLRQKCGLVPVMVEIEREVLEQLYTEGALSEEDREDRHKLAESLGYILGELFVSRRDGA